METVDLQQILNAHQLWLNKIKSGKWADLGWKNLVRANLKGANLEWANLGGAALDYANLEGINLKGANLVGASLRNANLKGANLINADLTRVDLTKANLENAVLNFPIACPEKGSFIGWKKANDYIVELEILSDAKRSSSTFRKCRCDKAKVLSITTLDGSDSGLVEIGSSFDKDFIYKTGEIVSVDNFDNDRWKPCAPGIHFFITRQEAVEY